MGCRANVNIYEQGDAVVSIYSHWDGYPSSIGKRLHQLIQRYKLVNGIPASDQSELLANGAGCLAAFIVRALKQDTGGVYLQPITRQGGDEFTYDLYIDRRGKEYTVRFVIKDLWSGEAIYDGDAYANIDFDHLQKKVSH